MSSKHPPLHFILLLLAYYCFTHTAAIGGITVQCLPDEASSLLQLKRSFYNPNLSSWQHGTNCCHWEGIGCDRASGQLITLDLSDPNLQSTSGLSPALFNLTSLTNLSLSGNNFNYISLPNFGFEQLTNLLSINSLDLSYNHGLYFSEPSFQMVVRNLRKLRKLYLDEVDMSSDGKNWSSSLTNSVPRLQYLSLHLCGLSGHIHSSFSILQALESTTLSQNSIFGQVPEFFAGLSSLYTLDLFGNEFEGQFSTKIFLLKRLKWIDLSWNTRLSRHLPNFPVENSLEFLDIMETNFIVPTATSSVNLKFMKLLGLSTAEVVEETISLIPKLPSLQTLTLYGSGLEKQNFSWIANFERLVVLHLKDYNISSSIPSWIANLTSLTSLQIENCFLDGRIPTWIGNLTNLSNLDLESNTLHVPCLDAGGHRNGAGRARRAL